MLRLSNTSGTTLSGRGLHSPDFQPGASGTLAPSNTHRSRPLRTTRSRRRSLKTSGRLSQASWKMSPGYSGAPASRTVSMRPVTNSGGVRPAATNAASTAGVRAAPMARITRSASFCLRSATTAAIASGSSLLLCKVSRWSATRLAPPPTLFRPSPRLALKSWPLSPTNAGRWMSRAPMNAAITGTRSSSCEGRIVYTFPCFSKMLLMVMSDRNGMPLAPMSEPTASNTALARSPDRPIMATVRGLASASLTLATARSCDRLSSRIWSSSRRRRMPPDALMRSCSAFASCVMAATSPESKQRSLRELRKMAIECDG